ncbi:MAG: HEAT repeat domain-containing protein [Endomicrobia bacterium]|nr:HEAT repeat domain-containing protein [Endomicrobiia bacterium]
MQLIFFSLILCQNFQGLIDTLKFGTKDKKLAEIKKINKLSKKEVEAALDLIISEGEPELCAQFLNQAQAILPPQTVLPKILSLLSQQPSQQNQILIRSIAEYISYHKDEPYVYNFLKESTLSEITDLQQKFYLIQYLSVFTSEQILPIVKTLHTKQDIIRLAISKLLASYNDNETKNILISYLSDEISEIRIQAVKSLLERKHWDTIPQILPMLKVRPLSEQVFKLLNEINDTDASHQFFLSLPLFEDVEIKKLCIIQAAKFKSSEYLSTFIQLYKKERNTELRTVLKDVIEKYDTQSAQFVFIPFLYDKELYDIIIPMLIKIKSSESIPYILNIYEQLPEHIKSLIDEFIPEATNERFAYHILQKLNTKDLHLRCVLLKTLSSFDIPHVYEMLQREIETTNNKQVIQTLILSIQRIKNYDRQALITKLLIKKCHKDIDLLTELLNQLSIIISKKEYKHSIFFPELVLLAGHKNDYISDKSIEILKDIVSSSSINEIRILYQLISPASDKVKSKVVKILILHPDNEFLTFATDFYHRSKNLELKKLLCEYVISLTSAVAHEIVVESLRSKNTDLQLHILNSSKGKIKYEDLQYFLPLCYSKNKSIRRSAVNNVANLFTEKERNYILNFLKDDDDEIKTIGIELCAKILPKEFVQFVPNFLESKNDIICQTTLRNLQDFEVREKNVIATVRNIATNHSSLNVRAEAVTVLSKWKNCEPETIEVYFSGINSSDQRLRSAAEFAFDTILPLCETAEDIYLKGIISENYNVKTFFLKKISEIKPQSITIKQKLKDLIFTSSDENLRNTYFSTLAVLITENDMSILQELYNANLLTLKLQIIKLIQNFPSSDVAEQILFLALKDQSTTVRQQAVEISQNFLNSRRIYEALTYIAQNDTNYAIRTQATKILTKSKR